MPALGVLAVGVGLARFNMSTSSVVSLPAARSVGQRMDSLDYALDALL
jgi:hypothetical protein